MNISALPTDNFYKFITVLGLLLTISGITLQWKIVGEKERQIFKMVEELASKSIKEKHIYHDKENYNHFLKKGTPSDDKDILTVKELGYLKNDSIKYSLIYYKPDSTGSYAETEIMKLNEFQQEKNLVAVGVGLLQKNISYEKEALEDIKNKLEILTYIGFGIFIIGMILWFLLFQLYQEDGLNYKKINQFFTKFRKNKA